MTNETGHNQSGDADWSNDAVAIIQHSDRAIAIIEDGFAQRRSKGPLCVFLGEEHKTSAYMIAQMRIAQILKDKGYRIAFGLERDHDTFVFLHDNFFQCSEINSRVRQMVRTEIDRLTLDNPVHLLALAASGNNRDAQFANQVQTRFLLENEISTAFNDAASVRDGTGTQYLNCRDHKTRMMMAAHGCDPENNYLDTTDRDGMKIRNAFILEHMMQHARQVGPDIYPMRPGQFHLAGNDVLPYGDSLLALAKEEDLDAVGIGFCEMDYTEEALADPALVRDCAFDARHFLCSEVDLEQAWLDAVMPVVMPGTSYHVDISGFVESSMQRQHEVMRRLVMSCAFFPKN